jgi:hypothetical protein
VLQRCEECPCNGVPTLHQFTLIGSEASIDLAPLSPKSCLDLSSKPVSPRHPKNVVPVIEDHYCVLAPSQRAHGRHAHDTAMPASFPRILATPHIGDEPRGSATARRNCWQACLPLSVPSSCPSPDLRCGLAAERTLSWSSTPLNSRSLELPCTPRHNHRAPLQSCPRKTS